MSNEKCPLVLKDPEATVYPKRRARLDAARYSAIIILKFVALQIFLVTLWWCLYRVGIIVWGHHNDRIQTQTDNTLDSDITVLTQDPSSFKQRAQTLLKNNPLIGNHNILILLLGLLTALRWP